MSAVVVVLPWVPVTTTERLPRIKKSPQHFRQRQIRNPAREYGLGFWIATRDGIANDDQIRLRR